MNEPGTDRTDLIELLTALERAEGAFTDWNRDQQRAVDAYRRALDALQGEALRRLIHALRADAAAGAALKQAVTDDVVYAVLRRHGLLKPSLNERIETALASVRPALASHGGDVRIVSVAPPRVVIEMLGACGGCASAGLTLDVGVKTAIEAACPEITEVVQAGAAESRSAGHGP